MLRDVNQSCLLLQKFVLFLFAEVDSYGKQHGSYVVGIKSVQVQDGGICSRDKLSRRKRRLSSFFHKDTSILSPEADLHVIWTV